MLYRQLEHGCKLSRVIIKACFTAGEVRRLGAVGPDTEGQGHASGPNLAVAQDIGTQQKTCEI